MSVISRMEETIKELEATVVTLTLENSRVVKTSKQRFETLKLQKPKLIRLEHFESHNRGLKAFLLERGFHIRAEHRVIERIDWSAMYAIKGLIEIGKPCKVPSVDGMYAIKVDGAWSVVRIFHGICWAVSFNYSDKDPKYEGLHFYKVENLILIDAETEIKPCQKT